MNAVAQVVVAVLLILVQVVLEVAEVLHLPVRLVLLVIRVRLEPLLEAVVQDQLIVVEVQKHRVVILQQVIVIPVLLPMALLVLLHAVILQLRRQSSRFPQIALSCRAVTPSRVSRQGT